jgi:hypothetical protein
MDKYPEGTPPPDEQGAERSDVVLGVSHTAAGGEALDGEETAGPNGRSINAIWASVAGAFGIVLVVMLTGRFDSLARDLIRFFEPPAAPITLSDLSNEGSASPGSGIYTFEELDIHPDVVFRPYTAGQLLDADVSSSTSEMIRDFRQLLDLYQERQGEDDNFTIRVVDNRSNELLEIYEIEDEREKYENLEPTDGWNWGRIDVLRRVATRDLVQKYASRGVPRPAITVKWGRKNQVYEARQRELPYIEYETRLARYLGLSLLATEIGTVETFNDDRLVSPVGARSRYQMMPYVLRQNDVHHYQISTAAGNAVDVYEEWHPLLTMEPAFATLVGYKNAVGHEIPGISAYHTGPGNIYMVYRMFLTAETGLFLPESSVMDAYMWAVTTGYDKVSSGSSFKTYSRGYVASIYGSLRATQALPIDSTKTLEAIRVQIRPGTQIFLSELLRVLETTGTSFDWGPDTEDLGIYDRFRKMNQHFVLPAGDGTGVDPRADVRLVAEAQGAPVHIFLPLGASEALSSAGLNVIDEGSIFRYTHDTYARPPASEMTVWDRQYEELVRDVANFGFSSENRQRLNILVDRFRELADARPSHFRQLQLEIIQTHQRIWQSGVFDKLASAVSAARGRTRSEPLPPSVLPRSSQQNVPTG